jgi:hypothetical protein
MHQGELAGSRESKEQGLYAWVMEVLEMAFGE